MSESSDIIESELRRYYGDRRTKHGFGAGGVGWKSAETQAIIFRQITKVIEERSGFSIADLGCGLGHLYDFLRAEGYADFRYAGYDLLPEMAEAARGLRKESDAVIRHITDAAEMEPADYVVAAGTFNLRYSLPECDRLAHLLRALHAMHERSRVGFAFNALTKYSDADRMELELYYADPGFLFDYCKRNFSRNVALLHDYTLYEFTILVRKRL